MRLGGGKENVKFALMARFSMGNRVCLSGDHLVPKETVDVSIGGRRRTRVWLLFVWLSPISRM